MIMTLKTVVLWSAIVPFAIANGILRDLVLARRIGLRTSRTLSGLILISVVFAWSVCTIRWLGLSGYSAFLLVGSIWAALTVTFELVFGRLVAKRSWEELKRPYRFADGDIWPIVLGFVLVSPLFAGAVHGLI